MAELTRPQRERLIAELAEIGVDVTSGWDPDLSVEVERTTVTFHVSDRSFTVGNQRFDGDAYTGPGFVRRLAQDAVGLAKAASAAAAALQDEATLEATPEEEAPKVTTRPQAPLPPTSGPVIPTSKPKPAKAKPRVERRGTVLYTKP